MKLKEILGSLDRTNPKLQTDVDWEKIGYELSVDIQWSEDTRLKAYYISVHLCTDTWVGTVAYFLDDEFVCISEQHSRKSNVNFSWLSPELALKVKLYLIDISGYKDTLDNINIVDLDEEMGTGYPIDYCCQLMPQFHQFAKLKSTKETVQIKEISLDKYYTSQSLIVDTGNGDRVLDVRDLEFEYAKYYKDANITYNRNSK